MRCLRNYWYEVGFFLAFGAPNSQWAFRPDEMARFGRLRRLKHTGLEPYLVSTNTASRKDEAS